MKKTRLLLSGLLLSVSLGMVLPAVSFAATDTSAASSTDENDADETTDGGEFTWVYDAYGLLSDEQYTELEDELAEIYDEYKYDVVLAISPDIGEEHDYRQYAATFMQTNEIGYGDTHEGMCIFHQPDARNITIVFRGETQDDFTESIQEEMLDKCKERLKADDPFGGYQSLIRDLKSGLSRISEGKKIRPMDIDDGTVASRFFTDLLMAFVIMAIPTALMTWHQVRKMKTKVQQSNADQYTADGGLELTEKRDIFLYTTMTKTEKPKNDDNDSDSGSFSSGGESFSGSSSDY
ncbi:MAG: TPM domain-containing protein [Blautia sp.]